MIPNVSVRHLIQEDYYPDEFKVLVCCLLLNKTKGDQVRKIVRDLFEEWPDADSMASADQDSLADKLRTLGLQNRRARCLKKFSSDYVNGYSLVEDLHGVGEYALDCWKIFFLEELPDRPPSDHALVDYYVEAKAGFWPKEGWPLTAEVISRREKRQDELKRRQDAQERKNQDVNTWRWCVWNALEENWHPLPEMLVTEFDGVDLSSTHTYTDCQFSHSKRYAGRILHIYVSEDGTYYGGFPLCAADGQ